jgi:hypothetical protein
MTIVVFDEMIEPTSMKRDGHQDRMLFITVISSFFVFYSLGFVLSQTQLDSYASSLAFYFSTNKKSIIFVLPLLKIFLLDKK